MENWNNVVVFAEGGPERGSLSQAPAFCLPSPDNLIYIGHNCNKYVSVQINT